MYPKVLNKTYSQTWFTLSPFHPTHNKLYIWNNEVSERYVLITWEQNHYNSDAAFDENTKFHIPLVESQNMLLQRLKHIYRLALFL